MYLCFVSFSRQKREELAQKVAEERARREEESRRLEAEQAREREEQLRRQAEERERREREDQERAQKQVGALPAGGPGPESGRGAGETSPRVVCARACVRSHPAPAPWALAPAPLAPCRPEAQAPFLFPEGRRSSPS